MKGWYVISSALDEPEEITGKGAKQKALKIAKEIYDSGKDYMVFIKKFDDDNPDGYFAGTEEVWIKEM